MNRTRFSEPHLFQWTTPVSVNHTRFLKEDHLPDWARRDNQVEKGGRVERILDLLLPFLYFVSSSYLLGPEIQFFGNKLEKLWLRKWKEVHNLIDSTKKFISTEMTFQDRLHNFFLEIPRDGDILWCCIHIFMEHRYKTLKLLISSRVTLNSVPLLSVYKVTRSACTWKCHFPQSLLTKVIIISQTHHNHLFRILTCGVTCLKTGQYSWTKISVHYTAVRKLSLLQMRAFIKTSHINNSTYFAFQSLVCDEFCFPP